MAIEQGFHRAMPKLQTFRNSTGAEAQLVVLAPDEDGTLKARQFAAQFRKAVYVQVVNVAEVNGVLNEMSHRRAPSVSIVLQPDGTLLWKGYLKSHSQFPTLRTEVRQDLPFLGKDDDKIVYGEEMVPKIISLLSSAGIDAGIVVKSGDSGIIFEGNISPEKSSRLKETLSKVSDLYPGVSLENKLGSVAGGSEIENILGGKVAGVTFGKSAWIELTNGTRLFPGTLLANGMTLIGITPREISFQTPGGVMKMSVEAVTAQPVTSPKR